MSSSHPDHEPTAVLDAMVPIRGGRIFIRDEGSRRVWPVTLLPYAIASTPVTVALWNATTNDNRAGDPLLPITDVSWSDAVAFCNALSLVHRLTPCYQVLDDHEAVCDENAMGFRLPTEAEWEYACRAGSNDDRYGPLDEIAWHAGNAEDALHPVGQKQANAWGLSDTIGNVWEWCWDLYDGTKYGRYRVFRGGGFSDDPAACRASCRRKSHPSFRIDDLGFRLARNLAPTSADVESDVNCE